MTDIPPTSDSYNYSIFNGQGDFEDFPKGLRAGTSAPDFTAVLLETGQSVQLSDYWRQQDLVVEFGSFTWPYCSLASPALEAMAESYAYKGFGFLFVYVREAHPGECYGPHRTMEQKLTSARAFRDQRQIERPILVDDLQGTAHHLYGLVPNMTYVIARGGRILFRSDWTDPPTIELLLNYHLNVRAQRREGARLTPFYAEFAGYRSNDRQQFIEGLKVAGPQAVDDYMRMVQVWAQQAPSEE